MAKAPDAVARRSASLPAATATSRCARSARHPRPHWEAQGQQEHGRGDCARSTTSTVLDPPPPRTRRRRAGAAAWGRVPVRQLPTLRWHLRGAGDRRVLSDVSPARRPLSRHEHDLLRVRAAFCTHALEGSCQFVRRAIRSAGPRSARARAPCVARGSTPRRRGSRASASRRLLSEFRKRASSATRLSLCRPLGTMGRGRLPGATGRRASEGLCRQQLGGLGVLCARWGAACARWCCRRTWRIWSFLSRTWLRRGAQTWSFRPPRTRSRSTSITTRAWRRTSDLGHHAGPEVGPDGLGVARVGFLAAGVQSVVMGSEKRDADRRCSLNSRRPSDPAASASTARRHRSSRLSARAAGVCGDFQVVKM